MVKFEILMLTVLFTVASGCIFLQWRRFIVNSFKFFLNYTKEKAPDSSSTPLDEINIVKDEERDAGLSDSATKGVTSTQLDDPKNTESQSKVEDGDYQSLSSIQSNEAVNDSDVITNSNIAGDVKPENVVRLSLTYLVVYWIAMYGDWLMGPYTYLLFAAKGFNHRTVILILSTGYISSATLGLLAGAWVDTFGRKKGCLGFCFLYSMAIFCYHSNYMGILLLGRVLDGIASSLLNSSFDAWFTYEYKTRYNYPLKYLPTIYQSSSTGTCISAVVAGLCSSIMAKRYGPIGPTHLAVAHFIIAGIIIIALWPENRNKGHMLSRDIMASFKTAVAAIVYSKKVWVTGLLQCLFEGVMITFVYFWSPSLPASVDRGIVFACLICSIIIGSSIVTALKRLGLSSISNIVLYNSIAGLDFLLCAFTSSETWYLRLISFCVFEVCCGMHFTIYYSFRTEWTVPEENRVTIINLFRLPLNIMVIIMCITEATLKFQIVMICCSVVLSLSTLFAEYLRRLLGHPIFQKNLIS